ncbi:MAG: DUF4143 domain-containing protein [Oscillospiraceae bacterium]|nr:DUF4143 domain-containing protein [Oscillospiraceae bacterium]
MDYIKRIIDDVIELKLQVTGGILIRGPKWCGKTTSAEQFAKSTLKLQDTKTIQKYKQIADNDIFLLLEGENPRLIDEWQVIPNIWNAVRTDIDEKNEAGLFILTGSTIPPKRDEKLHTGIGRFSFVEMKPFTLFESEDSNGSISLKDILDGNAVVRGQKSDIDYRRLAYLTCRGGWPTALKRSEKVALEIAKEYVKVLTNSDISEYDGVQRKADLARTILRAYSRHVSTMSSNKTMFDDIRAFYGNVTDATIYDYLSVYKSLYVIEDVEAWNPNLRSKTSIRTSPKKAFVDPSIGIAALGISPGELALDPETFGLFFENLVNRDLSVYAGKIGGTVRHYRDRSELECDHVIHFENGKYGLVETKLGSKQTDYGIERLREMRDLIKTKNATANRTIIKEPDFYMVINGGETAFTTEDGIFVVPIGCLKD